MSDFKKSSRKSQKSQKVGTGTEVTEGNTKLQSQKCQGKSWCFTVNNYTDKDVETLTAWSGDVTRLVATKEVGAEEKTPHIQGFVTFKRNYRFKAIKKLAPTWHWEQAKTKDAGLYCLKTDSDILLNIDNRKQGHRSDLDQIRDKLIKGVPTKELWMDHFASMTRYHKGFDEAKKHLNPKRVKITHDMSTFNMPRLELKNSTILWGAPNTGKTSYAKAHFTNPLVVSHMDDLLHFTPDHDGIVFDDMDFKHLPRSTMIYLADVDEDRSIHCRYSCAQIPANTKKIFCTNTEDGMCMKLDDAAIMRRCEIVHIKDKLYYIL